MPIELGVFLAFVALIAIMAVAWRGSTLEDLEPLPDESILCEEAGGLVELHARPSRRPVTRLPMVHVRLTDRRLIVSQKPLLARKRVLRTIVFFEDGADDGGLGGALKRGFVSARCRPADVILEGCEGGCRVTVPLTGGAILGDQRLVLVTQHRKDFERALGREEE